MIFRSVVQLATVQMIMNRPLEADNITIDDTCGADQNFLEDFSATNPLYYDQRIIFITFIAITTCCSVITNTCSLAILPRRSYQTLYKGCLISLSVSDLLLALFDGMDNITRLAASDIRWELGREMCSFIPFITTVCILASSLTLTCIAVDRFHVLICVNETVKLGIYSTTFVLFVIWSIAVGASSPMFIYYNYTQFCVIRFIPPSLVTCSDCPALCLSADELRIYFPVLYAIIFVPLLFMFMLSYFMLARHVWKSRQRGVDPQVNSTTIETNTGTSVTITSPPQPPAAKTDYTKRKLRTFKVILTLILTFVFCRLPQWTFTLATFSTEVSGNSAYAARTAFTILTIANTAVNPLLYLFLDNVLHVKFLATQRIRGIIRGCWSFCELSRDRYDVKQ